MIQDIKPYIQHVKGNTYCIITGYCRFPLYKYSETEAILLDSGLPRDWPGILECIQKAGLRITAALTTHGHPDHLGNHENLRKTFGTKIYMSDYAEVIFGSAMGAVAGSLGMSTYRGIHRYMKEGVHRDERIDPKAKTVTVEGVTFEVLHTPGHSAEHLCFVTPDRVAYLGDAVLSEQVVRAIRLPYCVCPELDLASKELLARTDYDLYILAHNAVVEDIREITQLNRNLFLEKIETVAELCDDFITLDALTVRVVKAMGGDLTSVHRMTGARRNVQCIVDYLVDTARLTCRAREGYIEYIRKQQ